ncbi:hypothetical protein F5B17DRAFT_325874 [Nemania serpens]|nr:hypothetical protein F5B17DRAFT_325874 [Nemania serpens]
MESHNRPDGPPPPYSETDIYSHSHGSRNRDDHLVTVDDDASIAPSSSHSNAIDTPPESPLDVQYGFAGPSQDEHTTASAQAYFDSRPPNRSSESNVTIALEIRPDATPSDFPYPKQAHGRDVTEQDWQTFINYLIPGHAASANSRIIDRKMRMAGDAQPFFATDNIVETQFASLKLSESASVSLQNIDAVVREWNHGFFEPRGITISQASPAGPAIEAQTPRTDTARANAAGAEQARPQPQQSSSWWRSPFSFADSNNGSLRIGPLHIDGDRVELGPLHIEGDRVALGSTFEADRTGVRWHGQHIGNPLFEANASGVRSGPGQAQPHPFGRHGGPWAQPFGGLGRGRGGGWEHHRQGRRDHSRSSISSSSSIGSSSSSDSDSSIGSLPDWDDLKDTQLPVAKRSIQTWLSHPDQPVTRNMLKQVKADIKAAKKASPMPHDPAWNASRESLRREVKDLLQQFKALKKQQRAAKRTARRELRKQKRAAKKERRERKRTETRDHRTHERESRRMERAARRAERDAERHARRARHHHAVYIPPIPSTPPVPPMPHGFPGWPAGLFGRGSFSPRGSRGPGSGFGRGFGPSSYDPGPDQVWGRFHNAAEEGVEGVRASSAQQKEEVERARAASIRDRERSLATAQKARETAAEVAEESVRVAMEAEQRSRAAAQQAMGAREQHSYGGPGGSGGPADINARLEAEMRALEQANKARLARRRQLAANLGNDDEGNEWK